jgi:hypothetical protein
MTGEFSRAARRSGSGSAGRPRSDDQPLDDAVTLGHERWDRGLWKNAVRRAVCATGCAPVLPTDRGSLVLSRIDTTVGGGPGT